MSSDDAREHRERRRVTIMFGDLQGYAAVAEANDPEIVDETVGGLLRALRAEIERFGGRMPQQMGDGFLALFGTPAAREDDAQRAIECALSLQLIAEDAQADLAAALGASLPLRLGLNTGPVVVARPTEPDDDIPVTGDAVNVAARLEPLAEPGGVLVSQATRNQARQGFDWGPAHSFSVKNRLEPVVAYALVGVAAERADLTGPIVGPFIGRTPTLSALAAEWALVKRGSMRVVVLEGAAGTGKSRLVHELIQRLESRGEAPRVALGSSPPRGAAALEPFRHMLIGCLESPHLAADALDDRAADALDTLISSDGPGSAPVRRRSTFVAGIASFLDAWLDDEPGILVLEDAQWADASTLKLINDLRRRLGDRPLLVVVVRRIHGRTLPVGLRRTAAVMTVPPFELEESEQLLDQLLPDSAQHDAELRTTILAKAEGNPLFLEEIVKLLASAEEATSTAAGSVEADRRRPAVPDTVEQIFLARLDEIEPRSRRVAQEAAVVGRSFPDDLLAAVTETPRRIGAALRRLEQGDLLRYWETEASDEGHEFIHYLTWNTVYESLLLRRRAELHLRTAEAIERMYPDELDRFAETLALHYELGGREDLAVGYHLRAGEKSSAAHAKAEARAHRRRSLQLTGLSSFWLFPLQNPEAGRMARAAAFAVQCILGVVLVAPVVWFVSTRSPPESDRSLGLPAALYELDVSAVVFPFVAGGLPVFVAFLIVANWRAPAYLRSPPGLIALARDAAATAVLVLASTTALLGVAYLAVRHRLLGPVVEAYYVSTVRRFIVDEAWTTAIIVLISTLIVSTLLVWWMARRSEQWRIYLGRRHQMGRSPVDVGDRRSHAQLARLLFLAGGLAALVLLLQLGRVLPSASSRSPSATSTVWMGLVVVAMALAGLAFWCRTHRITNVRHLTRRMTSTRNVKNASGGRNGIVRRPRGIGFEVPLLLATAFGLAFVFAARDNVVRSFQVAGEAASEAEAESLIDWFPESPYAHSLRGGARLTVGDPSSRELALGDFERSLELDPQFTLSLVPVTSLRLGLGDLAGAVEASDLLVELEPDHPTAYLTRSLVGLVVGDTASASRDLLTAATIDLTGGQWDALFARCDARERLQQLEAALDDCLAAGEANRHLYGDGTYLGRVVGLYRSLGRDEEAIEVLRNAGASNTGIAVAMSPLTPVDLDATFPYSFVRHFAIGPWYDMPGTRELAADHGVVEGWQSSLIDPPRDGQGDIAVVLHLLTLYETSTGAEAGFGLHADPAEYSRFRRSTAFPAQPSEQAAVTLVSSDRPIAGDIRMVFDVTATEGTRREEVVVTRVENTVAVYIVTEGTDLDLDQVVAAGQRLLRDQLARR